MKTFLIQFLTYNDDANRRFIEAIASARPQNERIFQIFSHILNAHRIWNTRLGGVSPTRDVWDVHPIGLWPEMNKASFDESLKIVGTQPLDRIVDFKDIQGNRHRRLLRDILIHEVNHSSYHRGQLAILPGQEGNEPPRTNYTFYLPEAE
jgi:uncharacterized damage-inducible protein DinB